MTFLYLGYCMKGFMADVGSLGRKCEILCLPLVYCNVPITEPFFQWDFLPDLLCKAKLLMG